MQLEAQGAQLDSARTQLGAHGTELERARSAVEANAAELDSARTKVEAQAGELESARTELAAKAGELERTQAELESTRAAADDLRAEREQAQVRAQQLLNEAEQARAAAEAIRAEFAFEPGENGGRHAGDPPPAQRTPWSVPAPTAPAAATTQPGPARPELPAVGPGEAAALIALDGSFRRLDDAFCSLLGCREEDLRAARWPSIIDRENLTAHQEIARALKAGEIRSAEVETVYMHAQGLLVPIAGTISLHRPQPGGEPYFLFRAEVSRTAGMPGVR
jgi:PAS domain S-box-containing protein